MRTAAYSAAALTFLVWLDGTFAGFAYAETAFGIMSPGCCHGPPSHIAGVLAIIFPMAVLALLSWSLLSRRVERHPGWALIAFLVSLPIGVFFTFSAGLEVTPL